VAKAGAGSRMSTTIAMSASFTIGWRPHKFTIVTTRTSGIAARFGVLAVGALITLWVVALSYDPVISTGMTGWIYGPNVGRPAVVCVTGVMLALSVWFDGRTRLLFLIAWLIVLAAITHRLVVNSNGLVSDIWLTVEVQSLDATQPDDEAIRCAVGTWVIRCEDRNGRGAVTTVSPIPFAELS
jgi:hypothetical protein